MGYAGYAPGNRIAEKLTPLQQALQALPLAQAQDTLEMIDKLTRNVVRNPTDDKFRNIKLSNPKIAAAITNVPFAVDALLEMGWVHSADGLALPAEVNLNHEVEVVALIDAKDHFKKEEEKERKRKVLARKELDPEREVLQAQMDADRREKAAEGPVTKGSVARVLGHDGPTITRAADIGIGKSSGG